jgi:hypothetical protein
MARYFVPITVDELKAKVEAAGAEKAWGHDIPEFSPHVIVDKLGKDLKVRFDLENFTMDEDDFGPEGLCGYHTLPNGLTYCGMAAGGDWEFPVFFIVYWDGKKIRGYVPTKGNPWNSLTKTAFGNHEELDLKDAKNRWPEEMEDAEYVGAEDFGYVEEHIREDILERILPKPEKEEATDVHTEHCCVLHGCKYGKDDECSVMLGDKSQSFPCEQCRIDGIDFVADPEHPDFDVLQMNSVQLMKETLRLRKELRKL